MQVCRPNVLRFSVTEAFLDPSGVRCIDTSTVHEPDHSADGMLPRHEKDDLGRDILDRSNSLLDVQT
jgi:hypothetical protein